MVRLFKNIGKKIDDGLNQLFVITLPFICDELALSQVSKIYYKFQKMYIFDKKNIRCSEGNPYIL